MLLKFITLIKTQLFFFRIIINDDRLLFKKIILNIIFNELKKFIYLK